MIDRLVTDMQQTENSALTTPLFLPLILLNRLMLSGFNVVTPSFELITASYSAHCPPVPLKLQTESPKHRTHVSFPAMKRKPRKYLDTIVPGNTAFRFCSFL